MTQPSSSKQSSQTKKKNEAIQMTLELPIDKEVEKLLEQLKYLKLPGIAEHYEETALKANKDSWTHVNYLTQLIELENNMRQERAIERKVRAARFPFVKTLEQFSWNWPKQINQLQIKDLFRLQFLKQQTNIILLGGVGLGKTHLTTALGHHACLNGKRVLFTNTVNAINSLIVAQKSGRLKLEMRKYIKPEILILDELCKALHKMSWAT